MPANEFPAVGTVLWAVDVDLEQDIFRKGASTKPNVDFLRFIDLDIRDRSGRIEGDLADRLMVEPDQGISLFLQRLIGEGLVVLNDELRKVVDKSLQTKVHWWGIDRDHPVPAGLILKYDGVPPGHCVLTVTRTMTVSAFLALVALVPFRSLGHDIIGPA